MFAQFAITLIIICLIIWAGNQWVYKPYMKNIKLREIDIERLKAKKRKLEEMKAEIQSTTEEINVTEEMDKVEKQLQDCERELNRLEKKRGKRKRPQQS